MGYALNQIGTDWFVCANTPTSLTMPDDPSNPPRGKLLPSHALIYVENDGVAWRADGIAPDAALDMFLGPGGYLDWTNPEGDYQSLIQQIQFVNDINNTGEATIRVAFFG